VPDVAHLLASVEWKSMWGFVLEENNPLLLDTCTDGYLLLPPNSRSFCSPAQHCSGRYSRFFIADKKLAGLYMIHFYANGKCDK
jgi:hypothetical protein